MNITAQVLGLLALVFIILCIQQKTKEKLLKLQLVGNVFYAIQYLLLMAWSATCMSGISFFRSLIFHHDTEKGIKTNIFVLVLFMIIIMIFAFLTFDGYYSLIPVIITLMYTYAIWQNNMTILRIISIIIALCWIVYNFIVGAYTAIIGSIFELASAVIALIRFDQKNKNT